MTNLDNLSSDELIALGNQALARAEQIRMEEQAKRDLRAIGIADRVRIQPVMAGEREPDDCLPTPITIEPFPGMRIQVYLHRMIIPKLVEQYHKIVQDAQLPRRGDVPFLEENLPNEEWHPGEDNIDGLYEKYAVWLKEGVRDEDAQVKGAFILKPYEDPHARQAIRQYAASLRRYAYSSKLADDLDRWVDYVQSVNYIKDSLPTLKQVIEAQELGWKTRMRLYRPNEHDLYEGKKYALRMPSGELVNPSKEHNSPYEAWSDLPPDYMAEKWGVAP